MNKHTIVTDINILDTYDFALAEKSQEDMEILKSMTKHLFMQLREVRKFIGTTPYIIIKEKDNLLHRMVIYNEKELLRRKTFAFVGFIGNKKITTKLNEKVGKVDWEIAQDMINNPHLFSYCSQALPDGNWFNFVLFDNHTGKKHVIENKKHSYAAHILAPKHFAWVRLHNGLFPTGIQDIENIQLQSTKYYNFENNSMWFGKREYINSNKRYPLRSKH